MARAMGGHERFAHLSPSTILAEACYTQLRRHDERSSEELTSKLHVRIPYYPPLYFPTQHFTTQHFPTLQYPLSRLKHNRTII
jgi:hypothetical protein